MLIPLICTQCGGKLEVENNQIFESGGSVVVLAGQVFQCPHCETKYLPGERVKTFPGIAGVVIGGNLAGTVIVGNGNTISSAQPEKQAADHPMSDDIETRQLPAARRPKLMLMPIAFGLIYFLGIPSFIFLWTRQQHIPDFADFESYGLLFAAICLFGALSNFAVLWGYQRGVIGQIGVWVVTAALNFIIQRSTDTYFVLGLILSALWLVDVYRNRQHLQ